MKIETLIDFPALQQLANALWHKGTARGAALLVGAGFSKYAELPAPDTLEPPLWGDLASAMAMQLYPLAPNDAPKDPLRLAEEYRTNFGQAALDEFVRMHIPDRKWEPGSLHRRLLNLPWSDILTTNWDTLLERAADDVSAYTYDIVRLTADLPHVRAPRIVKLHGSIGTSDHFIIAEEDYRTYPVRFAPFVNLARQIFIENELCLLGFSGDDPNFLQWSGWVRDHLGDGSRRIYLIGALRLEATKRKFLEARNVAPIDLHPLVQDLDPKERRAAATSMLLDFLMSMKPLPVPDWKPASHSAYSFMPTAPADLSRLATDHAYAASLLDQAAKIWEADRQSYPGWFVCPASLRQQLRGTTEQFGLLRAASVNTLTPYRRAQILYELAWRHTTAIWPVDAERAGLLTMALDPPSPALEKSAQLDIALLLLRTARQSGDVATFARWASFLEDRVTSETGIGAEVAYQRCLYARDRLDLDTVAKELHKIAGPDPIWRSRRASLHAEIGEFAEASKLIVEAHDEMERRQRRDRHSLWVRSRRAWTAWLLPATRANRLDGRTNSDDLWEYKEIHVDPQNEINSIRSEAESLLRERRDESVPVVVLFEPGYYRDPSRTVHFRGRATVNSIDELDYLMQTVGLPVRLNNYSIVENAARNALELAFEPTLSWYVWFLRWISSNVDNLFERYFSRLALTLLSPDVAAELTQRIIGALNFWRGRLGGEPTDRRTDFGCALAKLRLFIVSLSRLTIRQDTLGAANCLALAGELATDPKFRHPLLAEALGDLVKYSVQAVRPSERRALILPALQFPLSSEKAVDPHWWPRVIHPFWALRPDRPADDVRWTARINQLNQAAGAGQAAREEAVGRLAYLAIQGVLTEAEKHAFGEVLWSESGTGDLALPQRTDLSINMFAKLPAPQAVDALARVRARLFDANVTESLRPSEPYNSQTDADKLNFIQAFIGAAQDNLLPAPEQASRIFNQITAWRPISFDSNDPFNASFLGSFHDALRGVLGDVLALSIAPAMQASDLTEQRAAAALELIDIAFVKRARACLPYFANAGDAVLTQIVQSLRRGVIGSSFDDVAGATAAIETWVKLASSSAAPPLPEQLVEQIISAVETRREIGLHCLLQCARRLAEADKLAPTHTSRLSDALGDLLVETAYETIDPDSREAVSVSLIRAECVRLANTLKNSGTRSAAMAAWLSAADTDPLPEVRFALAN